MAQTEFEKMLAGLPYSGAHPDLLEMQAQAREKKAIIDALPESDMPGRMEALKGLVGSMAGRAVILPPFRVEFGQNIHLGDWVFVNFGANFMDSNTITLGSRTMVGPNVQFVTVTHPAAPEDRIMPGDPDGFPPFRVVNHAKPIEIGEECWIGTGAIILPGVSIGDGTTVGAGSVVTKSLPSRVVAVGNPARIIRHLDD